MIASLSCIIPDATHLRRAYMHDIALEVIDRIHAFHGPQAVFLLPDGKVRITKAAGLDCARYSRRDPHSFVGVYDNRATAERITEDLLAMKRVR